MAGYSETMQRHRRLSCLIVLANSSEYRCGDSLMRDLVDEYVPSTRDQVRSELMWLRDQGFVTVREISSAMMATITATGADVAAGRLTNPGIAKPAPKG